MTFYFVASAIYTCVLQLYYVIVNLLLKIPLEGSFDYFLMHSNNNNYQHPKPMIQQCCTCTALYYSQHNKTELRSFDSRMNLALYLL